MDFIVVEGRMPHFQCFDPNEETLAAMAEAERGDLVSIGGVDDLMAELNEDNKADQRFQARLAICFADSARR